MCRHGAVKVFQSDETDPSSPPELVKILQRYTRHLKIADSITSVYT
jgi:hypothetical protein